jgi:hypothetical protein
MITFWIIFTSLVFAASFLAHFSTYLGIDPMQVVPGIMLLHMLIFPPVIAAIICSNRQQKQRGLSQGDIFKYAPQWMQKACNVFGIYAFINFFLFMVLMSDGSPHEKDGRYFLQNHGHTIREITESEFHRYQAYIVRGFSGHWMIFSMAAMTMLMGVRRKTIDQNVKSEQTCDNNKPTFDDPLAIKPQLPNDIHYPSRKQGWGMLLVYLLCIGLILSGKPILAMISLIPIAASVMLSRKKSWGSQEETFESMFGCIGVLPNALLAVYLTRQCVNFVYLAIYTSIGHAIANDIEILMPRDATWQLSNGEPIHNRVWTTLFFVCFFIITPLGILGLNYLLDGFGMAGKKSQPPLPSYDPELAGLLIRDPLPDEMALFPDEDNVPSVDPVAERVIQYVIIWSTSALREQRWFIRGIDPDGRFYGDVVDNVHQYAFDVEGMILDIRQARAFFHMFDEAAPLLPQTNWVQGRLFRRIKNHGITSSLDLVYEYDAREHGVNSVDRTFVDMIDQIRPFVQQADPQHKR